MCGRFYRARSIADLIALFGASNARPNLAPNWNTAPTQEALVIRRHPESGARHLDALRWGLVPRWAGDAKGAAKLINARSDGVAIRPSFRESFARRRCIIPVDGFYEWPHGGGPRQPYAVARADGGVMAFAGVWDGWRAPDGGILRSFSIVTTDAPARVAPLHPRLPLILDAAAWEAWLAGTAEEATALLPPFEGALAVWPVSPRVNKVAENTPALLEPDPFAAGPLFNDPRPAAWQQAPEIIGC